MSAPDTTPDIKGLRKERKRLPAFDCYSDEQWQEIKSIVAALGLNADTVRVGKSRTLLREALEALPVHYKLESYIDRLQLTPRRAVKELRDTIADIDRVRRRLNIFGSVVANYGPEQALAASKALQDFVAASALRPRLAAARNAGSGSRDNARKPHRHAYLIAVEKIWRELTSQSPQRRKLKRQAKDDFLVACAAPTFAADKYVIKHFLDTLPE
jgi:hypothetical protein